MNTLKKIQLLKRLKIFNEVRNLYYRWTGINSKSLKIYRNLIKEGDLCFDVGANIGQKADTFLKLGARVIAFEPQEECIKYLHKKYRKNKKIIIVNKAVDEKEGEGEFYVCEADALSTMSQEWIKKQTQKNGSYREFQWNQKITVPTTTLDQLIKEYGKPVFCKIDVEGFEWNVVKGLTHPIPYISLEITPESLDSIKKCISYLSTLGSAVFNHCFWNNSVFTYTKWLTFEEINKALNSLPRDQMTGDLYVHFQHLKS